MYTLHRIGSDFALRRLQTFFPRVRQPEVEGRQRLSSEITASKSAIVHLVSVIIM